VRRLAGMRQVEGRGEQGDVGEGLGKVPHLASGPRIIFLCQQSEVVAQREQALEQPASLALVAEQDEVVGEPAGRPSRVARVS